MAMLSARYQRVFASVFPSEESPFVNRSGIIEQQDRDDTQAWAILVSVLKPNFSQNFDEDELLEAWSTKGKPVWEGLDSATHISFENWYVDLIQQELVAYWTLSPWTIDQVQALFHKANPGQLGLPWLHEYSVYIEYKMPHQSKIDFRKVVPSKSKLMVSDVTMSKYAQSFLGVFTKRYPTTILSPAIRSYFSSSFANNAVIDTTSLPPYVEVIRFLQSIGASAMMEKELSIAVVEMIKKQHRAEAQGQWTWRFVRNISEAMHNLRDTLRIILGYDDHGESFGEGMLETIALRALTELRVHELFDIIKEFPASSPAIEDLKFLIDTPAQRDHLVTVFRQACAKRLLHPAADTFTILAYYISTIKAFRMLDPPGVLLDKVARPIQIYLKDRSDTVSCILSGLMGDKSDGTWGELNANPSEDGWILGEESYGYFDDMNWEPAPIDANPDYRKTTSGDIVSMLLNIYENTEPFLKELQVILADKLLSSKEYDVDRETRNVELLKLRFGEASVQPCDVMIKDIVESKRVNRLIHTRNRNVVHPKILSRMFWPALRDEKLIVPLGLQNQFAEYSQEYAKIKRNRKLAWLDHLGTVEVEVELEDREISLDVSPLQAVVLYPFEEHDQLTLHELCEITGSTEKSVKTAALFWVAHGVLKEVSPDTFLVLEQAETTSKRISMSGIATNTSNVQSAEEKAQAEMQIYWTFIVGMLTNLGVLPVERIQSMLTMFVQAPNTYNRTPEELRTFLNEEVRKGRLEFVKGEGGGYKLVQS